MIWTLPTYICSKMYTSDISLPLLLLFAKTHFSLKPVNHYYQIAQIICSLFDVTIIFGCHYIFFNLMCLRIFVFVKNKNKRKEIVEFVFICVGYKRILEIKKKDKSLVMLFWYFSKYIHFIYRHHHHCLIFFFFE